MRLALALFLPLVLLIVVASGVPGFLTARQDLRPIVLHAHSGRVPVGDEQQLCHRVRLPRSRRTDVGRVRIFVRGGSHHVHLYRPWNGAPVYPPHLCPFAVDFDHWELVAATQRSFFDWMLPPGVAIAFDSRQPLMIQTHFVNAGQLATAGRPRARIVMDPVDPATVHAYAGAIFAQDRAVEVPPGRVTVKSRCMVTGEGADAHPMTLLALTGHYHFRGVAFDVYRVHVDGSLGERIYHHDGYDDPLFTMYKGASALSLAPGEGLEWWCTYQNDSADTFQFGPNTQRNEHCNLFGFYYPTEDPLEAIDCVHKEDGSDVRILAQ